ncbi:MAG: Gfo/Idh/MocA family oxidoreductase, partial [Granulosicoccaceae bacterium]
MTHNSPYPKPTRRLKLGFVGGGQGALIGEVHANGARLSNRWDIVAGALSSNPERAKKSGENWMLDESRVYSDYKTMALEESKRSDGIDAVVIVTPNHLHHPVAKCFMENGIDIVSDKPLTKTVDEAYELLRLQQQTGLVFGVTYAYSAHVMVRQAREMISRGMIGEIRQVHVEYFQEWATNITESGDDAPWRFKREFSGDSMTVADIGTHAAQLASFVCNKPITSVDAEFLVTGTPKELEDTAFMRLKLNKTIPGTLMVSQAAAGTQCGLRIRVHGTEASIDWQQENPESLKYTKLDSPTQIIERGYTAGMLAPATHLVRMPRGHPEALTDAWANL